VLSAGSVRRRLFRILVIKGFQHLALVVHGAPEVVRLVVQSVIEPMAEFFEVHLMRISESPPYAHFANGTGTGEGGSWLSVRSLR